MIPMLKYQARFLINTIFSFAEMQMVTVTWQSEPISQSCSTSSRLHSFPLLVLEASKEQRSTWPHQRASKWALCNIYFTVSLDLCSSPCIFGSLRAVFKAGPGRRAKPHTGSRQPLTPTISQHPQLHPSPARAHVHPHCTGSTTAQP